MTDTICQIEPRWSDNRNLYQITNDITNAYLQEKRYVKEHSLGIIVRNNDDIERAIRIIRHVEYVTDSLREPFRFIIQKEIIEGKSGTNWFLDYYSQSAFYRLRSNAYREFINCLDR